MATNLENYLSDLNTFVKLSGDAPTTELESVLGWYLASMTEFQNALGGGTAGYEKLLALVPSADFVAAGKAYGRISFRLLNDLMSRPGTVDAATFARQANTSHWAASKASWLSRRFDDVVFRAVTAAAAA